MTDEESSELRQRMLAEIAAKTIYACAPLGKAALSPRVMNVMAKVPRHEFVLLELRPYAYDDAPLPIGFGKTISQLFIAAEMTDLLDVRPTGTVLEIGTGLGYPSAILAELAQRVFSIELIEELAEQARLRLARQGHANVKIKIGSGCGGWPAHAPFDKVIVAATPELIPPSLIYRHVAVLEVVRERPPTVQAVVDGARDRPAVRYLLALQFEPHVHFMAVLPEERPLCPVPLRPPRRIACAEAHPSAAARPPTPRRSARPTDEFPRTPPPTASAIHPRPVSCT